MRFRLFQLSETTINWQFKIVSKNGLNINLRRLEVIHIPEITEIHLEAFPKSVWTKLGRTVVERFYLWHLAGPHTVVEIIGAFVDDRCVGFILSGVFNESTTGFIRQNRSLLIRRILIRPWLLGDEVFMAKFKSGFKLFKRTFKSKTSKDNGDNNKRSSYGLLSMGVLREHQNHGIGTALMKEAEKQAVNHGYKQAHFTVNPANTKAIHIYEKLGWQKVFEREIWKGLMRKNVAE